jgi:hypothetical protein
MKNQNIYKYLQGSTNNYRLLTFSKNLLYVV